MVSSCFDGAGAILVQDLATSVNNATFVGEGLPAPSVQWSSAATVVGPARKILLLSAVTGEMESATLETASAVIGFWPANRDPKNPDELIEAITEALVARRRARNNLIETFDVGHFRARVSHWMSQQTALAVA